MSKASPSFVVTLVNCMGSDKFRRNLLALIPALPPVSNKKKNKKVSSPISALYAFVVPPRSVPRLVEIAKFVLRRLLFRCFSLNGKDQFEW